jgi:hypothetical protein
MPGNPGVMHVDGIGREAHVFFDPQPGSPLCKLPRQGPVPCPARGPHLWKLELRQGRLAPITDGREWGGAGHAALA